MIKWAAYLESSVHEVKGVSFKLRSKRLVCVLTSHDSFQIFSLPAARHMG